MKRQPRSLSGLTLVEMMVTTLLTGILGLIVFSLLNVGTILGAKNTATNTAHQQARMALLQMTKNLHASASTLTLFNPSPIPSPSPVPGTFSGISFQLPAGDSLSPIRLCKITAATGKTVTIALNGNPVPASDSLNKPHFIIPGYQFDSLIDAVTGTGPVTLTLSDTLPDGLTDPSVTDLTTVNVSCFTTDLCSYEVKNRALEFHRPKNSTPGIILANGISQPFPFQTANNGLGVQIDISTADTASDRYTASHNVKSVGSRLSATIPVKARPTQVPTPSPTATP